MKKNRYRKALKVLKSKEIDSKLKKLEESPTVNTKSVYSLNQPGFRVGIPDPPEVYYPDADGNWPEGIPGTPGENEYVRPGGYWSGGSNWDSTFSPDFSQEYLKDDPTGRSTEGLIKSDGTVMTELPPDGASFILGPLVDGFVPNHGYDAYTNIGYLQKDTRQFVLLARITGVWKDGIHDGSYSVWNGTSTGLTIYNQNFTLEMAQWMQNKINEGKWIDNVPYFYSGGVPQRPQDPADCPFCPPGMYGGFGFGGGGLFGALGNLLKYGIGGTPSLGTKQGDPQSGDAEDAGFPWGLLNNLGDAISNVFGAVGNFFEPVTALAYAGAAFGAFLLQQQGLVNYTDTNPYTTSLPPQDAQAISDALNEVMNTIPRERWENLSGADLEKINAVLNPGSGPTPSNPDRPTNEQKNTDEYHNIVNNIGKSDAFAGQIQKDADGNEYINGINDNYVFTNDADASVKGAPELINFFANSFGAQSDSKRAGGGEYDYTRGDASADLDQFNANKEKYPNNPERWDEGPGTQTTFKLKNMPIRVELPPPSNAKVEPSNFGTNFAGGSIPKPNVKESKEILTESHRKILREIKKPVVVPELPKKYKFNFSGKYSPQNTPDKTASTKSDELVASGNARGQRWRTMDKYWQGYETTERMNVIYDRVGHGDQAWERIIDEAKKKNGWRNREIQEQLNIRAHELAMLKEDPNYISPFVVVEEVPVVEKDPTFNRVKKRLKKVTDYPDKPSKNGYPDTPPQVTTQPYKDRSAYYNKLDPQSAAAMPGGNGYDPNIDSDNAFRKVMKRARANGSNK